MKKIGIDIRCIMNERRTGVEEYTWNILENLFSIDKENKYILFINSWSRPSFNFDIFKNNQNVEVIFTRIPNKIMNFCFWYLSWPKLDKIMGGVDILWMPNIIFGAVSKEVKLVATIHDLSFERYTKYFSLKRKLWHFFVNPKKICTRADKIIAVSKSTKNDIAKLYSIDPAKIEVIYSGCKKKYRVVNRNSENLIKIKEKFKLPYKFILYLGTIEPRKNITAIIRAYNELQRYAKETNSDELLRYKLVIAGEKGWKNEKIFLEINNSEFKNNIKIIKSIPEKDKVYFYNLASLFVFPSFFEGFGFPPLEAMSCGVPVIASNNSSLPEIVGDGGVLIDPDKPDEIYYAMREIILNQEFRDILIQKGIKKSKQFDWKVTAEKMLKLFI